MPRSLAIWSLLLVFLGSPVASLAARLSAPQVHCHCPDHARHPPGDEPAYGPCEVPQALATQASEPPFLFPAPVVTIIPAVFYGRWEPEPAFSNHATAPETPPPNRNGLPA